MGKRPRIEVTGKGLDSLNAAVAARAALDQTEVKLAPSKRPTLGASALSSVEDDNEGAAWADEQEKRLTTMAENIGKAVVKLQSMERDSTVATRLRGAMEEDRVRVHTFINSINRAEEAELRLHYCNIYLSVLLQHLPSDKLGKNILCDEGVDIGFLRKGTEKNGVVLPRSQKDKPWDWSTYWTTPHKHEKLLTAMRRWCKAIDSAERTEKQDALTALKKGAISLLEAVEKKADCEVAFYTPNYTDPKDRFYGGGNIRASVKDGVISPVSAYGKCAGMIERAVAEGVSIPLSSVEDENFGAAGLAFAWHRTCLRAYIQEVEELKRREKRIAEQKAMKAKGTVAPADSVLRKIAGYSFFYMKKGWVVGRDDEAREYRNVHFLFERNEKGEARVAECPEYLNELFAKNREFTAEGDKFQGLEYPLGQMMRTMFSAFSAAERRNAEDPREPEQPAPEAEPTEDELKAEADKLQAEADAGTEARREAVAKAEAKRVGQTVSDDDGRTEFTARPEAKAEAEAALSCKTNA